ncbi:hypothetical protein OCAR_6132 [Afipia carboxidovorans OM5]|uniref:Uncharacterized protein n=1 Tax=Afipia carboxidovorans (strain ATCC 49405 / DSM 1227 / KCTC 32145 / OM5) TaxID=504832 RepID=B6JED0_AFIC5|nr:hypothetical protein [Afipia carboxidovorans]ACI93246.1 hypothetical protein OCAR_6132 [Afipia carboxidovorans OM5]AEI03033.1 hypothetical protein OCA4_c18960 [Afipia carboxidovorans OM4]AEI06610.1 hypothetical protein OCA5_c18970 [Afipia carboxidovorans OM5]
MTPIKDLNDIGLAILRIATCARMIGSEAHDHVVTDKTSHGEELLFLIDSLEAQTRELQKGFAKIQVNAREIAAA